jgi:glycyl-tRNA synthetase beta chain
VATGEFLLEVRCEEIPARMLQPAIKDLATRAFEVLLSRGLTPSEVETGFTPRRLVLTLSGLPSREPDRDEEMIGPPAKIAFDEDGNVTKAAMGFANKCGVEPSDLKTVETSKGDYLGATVSIKGRSTSEVLAEELPPILKGLTWAKLMRWGDGQGPWVRPVHGLVAVFEGGVVPMSLFGVEATNSTCGHPVHSPRSFKVSGKADYETEMAQRGIVVSYERRREELEKKMEALAQKLGGTLVDDSELLDRLTSTCGIPGVIQGDFDAAYLSLPREVLTTSLRDHQSAFTLESKELLLPGFLTVMDRTDDPKGRVRAGNEWVVAARLDDARFFYAEDRKRPLTERVEDLENLVFHADLGTYADKAMRIQKLSSSLCDVLGWKEESALAAQAADLLKVDLTTEMVKEFTSLQGVMGGVYAREDGAEEPVWQAIYDQYRPTSNEDELPRGHVGLVVAIADRVDTLVGMFGLGLIPSGSRDPFGLRRAAQGLVRMVLEADLPIDLDMLAARSARLYGDRLKRSAEEVLADLRPFVLDRVRHILGQRGYSYDSIQAAIAAGSDNLPDLAARVDAIQTVREEADFLSVVLAAKRIANIVKDTAEHEFEVGLLRDPAEIALHDAAEALRAKIETAEADADHESSLRNIAELAEVLDTFFVEVLVMDEDQDLRMNRISLLQSIQRLISRTARLTEVVVDRSEHRERTSSDN